MIEYLKQQVASEQMQEAKINKLREELQLLCLKIINDRGYFSQLVLCWWYRAQGYLRYETIF